MNGELDSAAGSSGLSTDLSYQPEPITFSDEENDRSTRKTSQESSPIKAPHSIQPLSTHPDLPAGIADFPTGSTDAELSESADERGSSNDAVAGLRRIVPVAENTDSKIDDIESSHGIHDLASSTESTQEQYVSKRVPTPPASIYNIGGDVEMRGYQKEISRNILEGRNDIIVLPTGTGKTRVALNLMIEKHLEPNSETNPRKKILYTAPNRVLARQQYRRISEALLPDYNTKLITGGMATDEEESGPEAILRLKEDIEGDAYDALIVTPQLIVNYFSGFPKEATLSHFSLIIVDECHTATEMTQPTYRLLKCYHRELIERELIEDKTRLPKLPQLVGLTATPVAGNPRRIENAINNIVTLCGIFDMDRAPTEVKKCKAELQRFTANPHSDIEEAVTRPGHIEFVKRIENNMNTIREYILEELTNAVDGARDASKFPLLKEAKLESRKIRPSTDYNVMAGTLGKIMEKIETQFDYSAEVQEMKCVKAIKHMKKYANARHLALRCSYPQVISELEKEICDLTYGGKELQGIPLFDQFRNDWMPELLNIAIKNDEAKIHDNLQKLKNKIVRCFEKDENTKMMIFADRRDVCRLLSDWINGWKDEKYRAHKLVSSSAAVGDENMSQSDQKSAMEGFRDGKYNILVSTSIGELGLDIPECSTVISYLYAKDFGSTKQLAGRCRVLDGSIHWIIDSKQKMMLEESKRVEELQEAALAEVRADGFDRYIFEQKKVQIAEQIKDEQKMEEQLAAVQGSTKILCKQCGIELTDTSKVKCYMGEQYIPFDKALKSKTYAIRSGGGGEDLFLNGTTAIGRMYCSNYGEGCNNHLGKAFSINHTACHLAMFKLEKVRFEGSDVNRTGKNTKGTWKQLRTKYYIEVIDYKQFMRLIKSEGFKMEVRQPKPAELTSLLMESMRNRSDDGKTHSSASQT